MAMNSTGLAMVGKGMKFVGGLMGAEQFKWSFRQDTVNGNPDEVVRALAPMKDVQASFQVLRMFAVPRLLHPLRTVPPSIMPDASSAYDTLIGSIIAGDGATAVGLPTRRK